jgi:transcriptional regulator with XRE-family HTH domain
MDHEFGKILRKIRISAGITQKELAEEIVVSASLISRYELGRAIPQIDTIRRILEVFGRFDISPDELRKLAEAGGYLREARETEEFLNRISESEYPEAVVSKYADEIRYPLDPAILHSDSPSLKDHLGRTGFAQALTIWLNRFWEEISQSDSNSFSMHIHGQWGIGKTTSTNQKKRFCGTNKRSSP